MSAWPIVPALLLRVALAEEPPDQLVDRLVAEALAARQELAEAAALSRAARARVPQARALPDPMLQVGVQNDGFTSWQVGKGETSWVLFMASQTFPFPGKTERRGALAELEVSARELRTERTRLTTTAEVRRAVLALEAVEARRALQATLTSLIKAATDVARARYEAGQGMQAELLRAQLELSRQRQQGLSLEAEARTQLQALNRLRGRPLDEAVTVPSLSTLAFPTPPSLEEATAALTQAPEVRAAQLSTRRAAGSRDLAERELWPDLSVGAGVMVRGALEPMWTVTLGVPLPVYAGGKQRRAVDEAEALQDAAAHGVAALEQLVKLRAAQRMAAWRTQQALWDGYQHGLLAEADAATAGALAQYRVGQLPFSAVLEAATTSVGVVNDSLAVLAEAWRLAIAQEERALDPLPTAPTQSAAAPSGM